MMSRVIHRSIWAVALAAATLCQSGCAGNPRLFGRPRWFNPGTIAAQRYRAIQHDPYVDNEMGPEVVGGRPRSFVRPLPEPVKNQPLP